MADVGGQQRAWEGQTGRGTAVDVAGVPEVAIDLLAGARAAVAIDLLADAKEPGHAPQVGRV